MDYENDRGDSALYQDPRSDAADSAPDHFIKVDGEEYAGRHFIIDLFGARNLDDQETIDRAFRDCVETCGATLLHIHLHRFTPYGGISGVAVLAESHISIHTWPERDYAALDVFMCGDADPEKSIDILRAAFRPERVDVRNLLRGAAA
ncbi:MAG: adenosylmethionine decarboxylase [Pseudomonadota bacterium]